MTSFGEILSEESEEVCWNEVTQKWDEFLKLNTTGYDLTDSTVVVPSIPKTVIPEPEIHYSFSTTLMVMAIELY